MNKFFDFIERVIKIFLLASVLTLFFVLVIFALFHLFGVELDNDAKDYFTCVVLVCMLIISYEFLKELENDGN